jgi:hypothetical protein
MAAAKKRRILRPALVAGTKQSILETFDIYGGSPKIFIHAL